MRTLLSFLAVLAIVASACASSSQVIEIGAEPAAEEAATTEDEVIEPASDEDPVEVAPVALRTGREAILANHSEGKPYVLWYWGAH